MVPNCKHCRKLKASRPRGLCWGCYYRPGVKEIYPVSKYSNRGPGNIYRNAPFAPFPTTAAPGTPEKLVVIQRRLLLQQSLWHPYDARYEGDPRPFFAPKEVEYGELAHAA